MVPSIVFLYGDWHGASIDTNTVLLARENTLFHSAYVMEQHVLNDPKLQYIVLRYGSFYAEESFHTIQLIEGVRKRKIPLIDGGGQIKNFIHADDAADAMVHAFLNFDHHQNRILNVSDFKPIKFRDILHLIASKTGSPTPRSIPTWLARIILGKDMYQYLSSSFQIAAEPQLINWQPKHNFGEFIAEMLENHPLPNPVN